MGLLFQQVDNMPIVSALLEDCPAVYKYKVSPNGVNNSWLIKQPKNKILIIYIKAVFYNLEWSIFNPIYRMLMHRGLKKQGYKGVFEPLKRLEVIRLLLKEE